MPDSIVKISFYYKRSAQRVQKVKSHYNAFAVFNKCAKRLENENNLRVCNPIAYTKVLSRLELHVLLFFFLLNFFPLDLNELFFVDVR